MNWFLATQTKMNKKEAVIKIQYFFFRFHWMEINVLIYYYDHIYIFYSIVYEISALKLGKKKAQWEHSL